MLNIPSVKMQLQIWLSLGLLSKWRVFVKDVLVQKSAFIYSVYNICYLESMETDAIQMHNSVIVHGIGELGVFRSIFGVFKYNKNKHLAFFLPLVLYIILCSSPLAIILTKYLYFWPKLWSKQGW